MNCPPTVAKVILDILTRGLLAIRSYGWAGEAAKAASEADHLHNLPDLLRDYKWDKLEYYWDIERPCYINRAAPDDRRGFHFDDLWQELAELVEQERPQ